MVTNQISPYGGLEVISSVHHDLCLNSTATRTRPPVSYKVAALDATNKMREIARFGRRCLTRLTRLGPASATAGRSVARMQRGDLPGGLVQLGPQLRRVQDFDLRAEREQLDRRGGCRVGPHPGLDPVLAPGGRAGVPADPHAGRRPSSAASRRPRGDSRTRARSTPRPASGRLAR